MPLSTLRVLRAKDARTPAYIVPAMQQLLPATAAGGALPEGDAAGPSNRYQQLLLLAVVAETGEAPAAFAHSLLTLLQLLPRATMHSWLTGEPATGCITCCAAGALMLIATTHALPEPPVMVALVAVCTVKGSGRPASLTDLMMPQPLPAPQGSAGRVCVCVWGGRGGGAGGGASRRLKARSTSQPYLPRAPTPQAFAHVPAEASLPILLMGSLGGTGPARLLCVC